MAERLNRRIASNQDNLDRGFERMARDNANLAKVTNSSQYLRNSIAVNEARIAELGYGVDIYGDYDPNSQDYNPGTELEELKTDLDNCEANYANPLCRDLWAKYTGYRIDMASTNAKKVGRAILKGVGLPFVGAALGIHKLSKYTVRRKKQQKYRQARRESIRIINQINQYQAALDKRRR